MSTRLEDQEYPLTEEQISAYRRDGFVQIDDVLTGEALVELRTAVANAVAAENDDQRPMEEKGTYGRLFIQKVNLWTRHPDVERFALCRRFAGIAARLAGLPVRIWHDQALFKEPDGGLRTPWHQDAHYWPHQQKTGQITIWLALKDATLQNGCMSFLPGTQTLEGLDSVNLADPQDLHDIAPQVRGIKAQACPLKAGSCTFHNGLTFHYAGANKSDGMREAFAVIYMPDGTTYSGAHHIVTDPLRDSLKTGAPLTGDLFPLLG